MRRSPSGYPMCAWGDECPYLGTNLGLCLPHFRLRRDETDEEVEA